jgi:type II protein arginine methyltransferase
VDIPRWHFSMLNDTARNEAFERAIAAGVRPGAHVVDIGAGTGLLSLLAARAGAARVDAYEAHPDMAEVAKAVLAAGDAAGAIRLHEGLSSDCELPEAERADLLVTEIFDCALIGEGVIPSLRAARRTLLSAGYRALPHAATLRGALLASPATRQLNEVGEACGVDLSALNAYRTRGHFPLRLSTWPHSILSSEETILELLMQEEPSLAPAWDVEFTADENGFADGVVAWFDLHLAAGVRITTHPSRRSHWMQAFVGFAEPLPVRAGDAVRVRFTVENDVRLFAQPVARPLDVRPVLADDYVGA